MQLSVLDAVIPAPRTLWRSAALWIWVAYALFVLVALPHFVVQFWFNQSLGFATIFWTNVRVQAVLFTTYGLILFAAWWLPLRRYARSETLRESAVHVGIWLGTFGGWQYARSYAQALLAANGVPFGKADPVFGNDLGFYVYVLPFWQVSLRAFEIALFVGLAAAFVATYDRLVSTGALQNLRSDLWHKLGLIATPLVNVFVLLLGLTIALRTYLSRYGLLLRNNDASGVRTGAEYLDVTGLFSSLNIVYLTAAIELGLTAIACTAIHRVHRFGREDSLEGTADPASAQPRRRGISLRGPIRIAGALLAVELGFFLSLVIRDHVFVSPNEPVIQREYIQRHMNATLEGYRLDKVDVHDWPLPASPLRAEEILASKTVQNAPFVSPWVSHLEQPADVHHFQRIAISPSTMVYGPVLQAYEQQQQLRPYYRFLSVDGVRYQVDGEKRMFASAVRELPSVAFVGSQEWLRYWGSAALQFTHGMGLVMSPANRIDEVGNPVYVVSNVPPVVENPAFEHEPRIYFGEGLKDDYVLTKVRGLREFDYATEQSRQEFTYPKNLRDGIPIRSWFRRLVFALYTQDITAFLFSRYIDKDSTRVHLLRTPISRATSIAPFLYLDSNINAFIADKKVLWMINGLATTDRYPYSFREVLGDKADERAVEPVPERIVNYAEDAVKITVDAYSGEIRFYKVADDPIVSTWQRIYPDLFTPGSSMPVSVKAQLTYPLQWFHVQFDDIYKRYHQRDPIEFYNVEDLWDDADEVLGSIGRGLTGYGTGDQMTFSYEGYNTLIDPVDLPSGVNVGQPGDLQYALLMPFTPEGARNLRSLIIAFQDPENYGRLMSLQIPQGTFVAGPEQVDAYIDNDRPVHQQVTMWIRHASEVIRGSTLLLPVRGDLLYLETIWVNSLQNDLPQLKLFALRYNNQITSGATLEDAILGRRFIDQQRAPPSRPVTGRE